MKKRTTFGYFLTVLSLCFVLAPNAYADDWYDAKILKVTPRAETGDVFVQFFPGANEKDFTGRAKAVILGPDAGANKIMAVLLTAISLNSEVSLQMANPPSLTEQVITSAGLVAP